MSEFEQAEPTAEMLYCEYGRVMHAAQTFEYTVRQLVSLSEQLKADRKRVVVEIDTDIARFFKRPLAQLATGLRVDEALVRDLRSAVSTRNTLAHEYFITTFLELNVGISTYRELVDRLAYARQRYEELDETLQAIVEERHRELGIDPSQAFTTAEEMRRAMLGDDDVSD